MTGAERLLRLGLPSGTRVLIGLGFAITEPSAVEALANAGAQVRLVFDRPETFHPKLYVITRRAEVVVFSGSGNLTGGGLDTNVEQYEELTFSTPTARRAQRRRFDALWGLGDTFTSSSAAWKHYRVKQAEIAQRRAELQRASVALTTAVARRSRASASAQMPKVPKEQRVRSDRRAQIAARRGGKLTTPELHDLLTRRGASKRVAVTGRVDGTTQLAWLTGLKKAYPGITVVNYGKVRDLDALIVGTPPSTGVGPTRKRRHARADHANWVALTDANKLPRLRRSAS